MRSKLSFQFVGDAGSKFWDPWRNWAVTENAVEIGRIRVNLGNKHPSSGYITLRDASYECRIHRTGRARWRHVPSRWVMYSAETELHAANQSGATLFDIEGATAGKTLRLRQARSGDPFSVERMPGEERVGEFVTLKRRERPTNLPCYAFDMAEDMAEDVPETFQIFAGWIMFKGILDTED